MTLYAQYLLYLFLDSTTFNIHYQGEFQSRNAKRIPVLKYKMGLLTIKSLEAEIIWKLLNRQIRTDILAISDKTILRQRKEKELG